MREGQRMNFFDHIELAPKDPILGLNELFVQDQRSNKVNLGVGSYKNEELKPYILPSVIQAEQQIFNKKINKEYLPIDGLQDLVHGCKKLVLDCDDQRIYGAHAIGGTGALYLGGQFLYNFVSKSIFLPDPSWTNHRRIFSTIGLTVANYPYYNQKKPGLDFDAMRQHLEILPKKSIVVLHACCQNPTGFDLSNDQWLHICEIMQKNELIAFFDVAYQGFGQGIIEDVYPLRTFLNSGQQFLAAVSYSKNFGLYSERVGNLLVVCENARNAEAVGSQIKGIIRSKYSSPAAHGAQIVAEILMHPELNQQWQSELTQMRMRLTKTRALFVTKLQEIFDHHFDFIAQQQGMFSYTGLGREACKKLIDKYAIYLSNDGRISIAGLNEHNVDYVIDSMKDVM